MDALARCCLSDVQSKSCGVVVVVVAGGVVVVVLSGCCCVMPWLLRMEWLEVRLVDVDM